MSSRGLGHAMARPGRRSVALAAVALLAIALAASPGGVAAHALLRASDPGPGAVLGSGPERISLTFSETPDLRLSSISVLDASGTDHATGDVTVDPGDPLTIGIAVAALEDGAYTVSWRTVSSVDGHISAGSFRFGVGVAPPSAPPGTTGDGDGAGGASQSGSPPAIVARWLLYIGLTLLVGAAFVAVAVARRPAPDLLALAAAGWVAAALGTVGVVGVQWAETGAPIDALLASSAGVSALARVGAIAVVGLTLALLAVARAETAARRGWALAGVAACLAFVVDVATGHAAAGDAWLGQVAVQSLHGIGAATWLGGLAGLLVALRSTPEGERLATAKRFSNGAAVSLAVVAVTGLVRAVQEIGTLDALVDTDFGRAAIAKSAGLLAIAALGAVNRFVHLRAAARVMTGLRRFGGAELALAVGVLGLSALLVNLTPPASVGAPPPAPAPILALGSDFGTSVKVRLIGSPGFAGENRLDLAVVDYDTEEPVDATGVDLRLELASRTGVEPATVRLEREAPGRFGAVTDALSIDGIWRATATVTVPGGAVDVPLAFATTIEAQPVDVLVSPGLPSIYTVALDDIGSAQVYLDPGAAGRNELHVTFFDPAGSALAVPRAAIAAFDGRGGALLPEVRRLDVGHFVSTIDARSGSMAVDVVGPLPAGAGSSQVHVHVTIEVQP